MSTEPRSRAWLEVDAGALRRNLGTIRRSVGPEVRILPLVKANAYGLGIVEAARVMAAEDPWGFGVATVPEGETLRTAGVSHPIIVLSPVPRGAVRPALDQSLTLSVSDLETLRLLAEASDGRRPPFHLEIDTGMGRSGFDWRRVEEWFPPVATLADSSVRLEGVFTHFHSADASDASVTEQMERFRETVRRMGEMARARADGSAESRWVLHAANSAAAIGRPDTAEGLVRPGIFLYGGVAGPDRPHPEPVVSLRARVVLVRDVPPGSSLGYGATHRAARAERWATVGIGYGDGLPRVLGNRGNALIGGRRVPIVGRISMDLTVVDITDLGDPAPSVGSEVTFIGSDGTERITLEDVAHLAGTISYEILTGFTARMPRVWTDRREGYE